MAPLSPLLRINRPIPCRNSLENFSLSEDDDERALEPQHGLVEASHALALPDEADDPVIEGVPRNHQG